MNKKSIHSYADAAEFLGSKNERPFAHNTRIIRDTLQMGHDVITVTYHGHPIVNFYPDRLTLSSCGWMTSTTKERLNWFIPQGWRVYQEKGVWYVWNYETKQTYTFSDGITFMNNGAVYNMGSDSAEKAVKDMTRRIREYVEGFITSLKAGQIPAPSGGDCWYCYMKDSVTGKSLGDMSGDHSHLDSHMRSSYYVPSLLFTALEFGKACDFAKYAVCQYMGLAEGTPNEWMTGIMERDIKSCLTRYLKTRLGIAR